MQFLSAAEVDLAVPQCRLREKTMPIFDFIKEAGEALFHGQKSSETSSSSPGSSTSAGTSGPVEQLTEKLGDYLSQLNLGIQNPQVKVEGDKAILEGQAQSQEAMEKAVLAVGNTKGIARVESKLGVPAGSSEPKFVTVKSGDTLSEIAKEALGDASQYMVIFRANQPMLKSPDKIFPGQKLRIPQENKEAA